MMRDRIGPQSATHHYGDIASGPRGGQGTQKGPDMHLAAFAIDGHPDASLRRVAVDKRGERR